MKENKSQDNKEPKGPYKHFERPTTSRRAMHHRNSESMSESTSGRPDKNSKGSNHSQLWAGLIIVAIILIALIPIVSSRLHSNSNNLAEKSVKVSKSSSSKSHKHKSKSSSSKKSKSKSSKKEESTSSSIQSQDVTPAVTSQSQSQSQSVESSQSSVSSYQSSDNQTTTQDQTQQATQNYQTSQNTWQSGSGTSEHRAPSSYTVQEGDSLSKIARENNTSVHHLEQLNGLESADSISIGQSIKLR